MTVLSPGLSFTGAGGFALGAARLRALQMIEARHRAELLVSIRRAERAIHFAEALDERFDQRFAALVMTLSNRSERSTHVPSHAI